jgi:hemerythrin
MLDRFESGEAPMNTSAIHFLHNWITGHILGADKEYAPWMENRG